MYNQHIGLIELKKKEWWFSHLPTISFFSISIVYFIVACYKLTYASLWFDEAIEFYYSSHLFSSFVPVPGGQDFPQDGNMYQKIIVTFQPPLYNFLMFFWLKISDSEWWFRFAGVVAGYCGSIGIYKTVKQYCNWKWATLSMLTFFSIYHVLYFIQECAEYNLLLAFIPWTIYFFFNVLTNKSWKSIILFIVFSILPIYSQYGAAFAILPMLLLVFIDTILSKDWYSLKKILIGYICAFIFAAIPLYVFFLKPQIAHQPVKTISGMTSFFYDNILYDFFKSFFEIFKWNIISPNIMNNPAIVSIFTISIFILIVVCSYFFFKSKNKILKYLIISNIITLCLYYLSVKTKIYAYPIYAKNGWNGFMSRYGLFFIPLWVSSFFYIAYNIFCIFHISNVYKKILLVFILFFSLCGIIDYSQHGIKIDHLKNIVDVWYSLDETKQKETILGFWGCSSFYYYFTHHKDFKEKLEENISYSINLNTFLSKNKIDSFYYVSSRLNHDQKSIKNIANKYDYTIKDIYIQNGNGILLFIRNN